MSLLGRKLARDARRQWVQFVGVSVVLALGVAVFGAAFDSYANLKTSYRSIYQRLDFADVTITGGDTAAIAARVRRLPGGLVATTRLQADVPFRVRSHDQSRTLIGRVVGQRGPGRPAVNALLVQEGVGVDSSKPRSVVVERHMADHFGIAVGDSIEVFVGTWRPLLVSGVAVSPEYLWPARDRQDLLSSPDDFGVVFAPDDTVAELAGSSATGQVLLRAPAGVGTASLADRVRALPEASGADVVTRSEQASNAALQQDVDAFEQLAVLFPTLFLAAAVLAAYVLIGRLVRTQRGHIGMLRANGFPRRRLLGHYLAFGALCGLGGSVVGAFAGLALARWLTLTYTSSLDIPLAVAKLHPLTPVVGMSIGTLAGLLAAVGPARAAIAVPPAAAMRGAAPNGIDRAGLIERLPGVRALPVRSLLVLRNLRRSPRRAVSTGLGVVLAGVLVLSSLGMLDTMTLVLDDQFQHVQRQDAQLYLAPGTEAAVQAAVRHTPGVARVERSVETPIVLSRGAARYQTSLTGFAVGTTMHRFDVPLPNDGVLLGSGLRALLGVDVGQRVQLTAGNGAPVSVKVAGFVREPIGSAAYASRAYAERISGEASSPSLLVTYRSGADRDLTRAALMRVPGVVASRDARGSEETVRELLGLFYAIVGIMLGFGAILASVVVFNTLSVNLAERTVELATLRAGGAGVGTLARIATEENLLLVLAAIPPGLAGGWLTGRWLMSSFNNDLYHFTLRLRPTTPAVLVVALLAVALAMHWPTRRVVRRLDVAQVVRERAL